MDWMARWGRFWSRRDGSAGVSDQQEGPARVEGRHARLASWLGDWGRDLAYVVRSLRRSPSFTVAVIATLSIGFGGVTLIYTTIHRVLLDPFPYRAPDEMVVLTVRENVSGSRYVAPAEFLDLQAQNDVFESVAGTMATEMHFVGPAGAERLRVAAGTSNMFTFLGVPPLIGRHFGSADLAPAATPVVILSHRTWTQLFAADPAVVSQPILLDERPYVVVGVMPPRFQWLEADLWIPADLSSGQWVLRDGRPRYFRFDARLRQGVSIETAEAQLNAIIAARAAGVPEEYRLDPRVSIVPLLDSVDPRMRSLLFTLLGAVALILILAVCNISTMLLARAGAREREIGLRAALGASGGSITRLLFAESLVLVAGGVVGACALTVFGLRLAEGWLPLLNLPAEASLELDLTGFLFVVSLGVVATVAFGLLPALHARRQNLAGLMSGGAGGATTRRRAHLRGSLLAAEVALALVLICGAGLLVRSFQQRLDFDLGFDPDGLYVVQLGVPPGMSSTPARDAFLREVIDQSQRIPGVRTTSVTMMGPPINGFSSAIGLPGVAARPQALFQFCSEGFLDALGIELVAGRGLTRADVASSARVALVNARFVAQYFGAPSPLGTPVQVDRLEGTMAGGEAATFEIVGVVADTANRGLYAAPEPEVYIPYTVSSYGARRLLMRAELPGDRVLAAVREQVRGIDPGVAITEAVALRDTFFFGFGPLRHVQRVSVMVLVTFATTGLTLLAFGIYGLVAYTASQQEREYAIRLALGAQPVSIARRILGRTLLPVGIGCVLGLAASAVTSRLVASQLYETSHLDPVALGTSVAIVIVAATCACALPIVRAMRVQPSAALRSV